MEELRCLEEMEKDRLKQVQEERIRLLKQHIYDLIGYLPKGIFIDRKEVEKLGLERSLLHSPTRTVQQLIDDTRIGNDPSELVAEGGDVVEFSACVGDNTRLLNQ